MDSRIDLILKLFRDVDVKFEEALNKLNVSKKLLDLASFKVLNIKNDVIEVSTNIKEKVTVLYQEDLKKMQDSAFLKLSLEEQKVLQEILVEIKRINLGMYMSIFFL